MGIIIGEVIKSIVAENKGIAKKMTISNNVKITEVHRRDLAIGADKKAGMAFDFSFISKYGETPSKIEVNGTILYIGDTKELDEIENEWKEKKTLGKITLPINNKALETGFMHAITLASQVRLPIPITLPRFVAGKQPTKPAKTA